MSYFVQMMISVFIFFPILLFFLILFISHTWRRDLRKSIRLAADMSTIFFILAIHFLLLSNWEQNWFFPLAIVMLVLFTILLFLHKIVRGTLNYARVFKFFWRSCFLIFSFVYVILYTITLVTATITYIKN